MRGHMQVAPQMLVHRGLRKLGFDLVRYDGNWFPERRRAEIMATVRPQLVVDVGANMGQYIEEIRANGYEGDIVAFEPLPDMVQLLCGLDDPRLSVHQVALGAREDVAQLNVSRNSWSSSLLPLCDVHLRLAPDARYVDRQDVQVRTLDSFNLEPDWLKIDVQGYENEVLAGATATIGTASVVEIELSFAPLYEGQPLAAETQALLESEGFGLADFIKPVHDPKTGLLLQADAILTR